MCCKYNEYYCVHPSGAVYSFFLQPFSTFVCMDSHLWVTENPVHLFISNLFQTKHNDHAKSETSFSFRTIHGTPIVLLPNEKNNIKLQFWFCSLTFISTFRDFKLNLICRCRCSTTGVNIFIQFSLSGVYLFCGMGIFLISVEPPWNRSIPMHTCADSSEQTFYRD